MSDYDPAVGQAIGAAEIKTQKRIIELMQKRMGYRYLGDWHGRDKNANVEEEYLNTHLARAGYAADVANKAVAELRAATGNLSAGLYQANLAVWTLLRYGASVDDGTGNKVTVKFIDFEAPGENDFAIAEEVTVRAGQWDKRPDLVVYVNGIALAVVEFKKSTVSVMNGICQNIANQKEYFIQQFFTTVQVLAAGNPSEGLRYGTIGTEAKCYLEWHEDGFVQHPEERDSNDVRLEKEGAVFVEKLDRQVFEFFDKRRFLEIVCNFIVFDNGKKKLPRYPQYYAVKRALRRLEKPDEKGGIIWHSQGSGKSLTMVWLAKRILEGDSSSRVLVVTDREELDDQIEKNFIGVGEKKVVRSKSGKDLRDRLNAPDGGDLLCSLIHKFGHRADGGEGASEKDVADYIEDLKAALGNDFKAKGNITIFVDECHRTQSGRLHAAMTTICPDAKVIGFTGTPLLKDDKKSSLETFGPYIHTYKFPEAVRDGVVNDLAYEARDIPQKIADKAAIDAWFDAKTRGLNERQRARLKQEWARMQNVYGAESRLERIAEDIIFDFATKPRLAEDTGNAMLVADSILTACKYYQIFQRKNFKSCAVITSYEPHTSDVATDVVGEDADTDAQLVFNSYLTMIGIQPGEEQRAIGKKLAEFEKETKRRFVKEPANMKLLIVVDKLLTGFDAPPCTYIYLDKSMRDHGLFQAVCRVNRLDGETKQFGYVVDYKQLFGNLMNALDMYSNDGAFAGFDKEDVEGLLKKSAELSWNRFNQVLEAIRALCEGVSAPKKDSEYRVYFCGSGSEPKTPEEEVEFAQKRAKLYSLANELLRAFAALRTYQSDLALSDEDIADYEREVQFYLALKKDIGLASGDLLDLKAYAPDMRYLIDTYIEADAAEKLNVPEDFKLTDFIREKKDAPSDATPPTQKDQDNVSEIIENNVMKELVQKRLLNPAFFKKISDILAGLIEERKQGVIEYQELLNRYLEVADVIAHPEAHGEYPDSIRAVDLKRAFFDNFGEDEQLANALYNAYVEAYEPGFLGNEARQNQIKEALYYCLDEDEEKMEEAYGLVVAHEEVATYNA